jgi:hypothetical protein
VLSTHYPGSGAACLLQEDILASLSQLVITEPGSRYVAIFNLSIVVTYDLFCQASPGNAHGHSAYHSGQGGQVG